MRVHNLKVQTVLENMKYIIPIFFSLRSPTQSFSQMYFNSQKPDSSSTQRSAFVFRSSLEGPTIHYLKWEMVTSFTSFQKTI